MERNQRPKYIQYLEEFCCEKGQVKGQLFKKVRLKYFFLDGKMVPCLYTIGMFQ